MLDITVSDATLRAVDRTDNVVEIETVGWDQPAPPVEIPRPVDASISGRATRLAYEASGITIAAVTDDGVESVGEPDATDNWDLPPRHYLVVPVGGMETFIAFDGAATLAHDDELRGVLEFPHPTPVTIGFRSFVRAPHHTVTVPRTPRGIAAAVSTFATAFTATDPSRSLVANRGHPPRIAYGPSIDIPSEVQGYVPDEGLELRLPDSLAALVPAAPLSAYLGASVTVEDRQRPVLEGPALDRPVAFSPLPGFQFEAAALLRRTFALDNLLTILDQRSEHRDWLEGDALSVLDLDAERCLEAPIAERLERYLAVDFGRVEPILPDWPSTVYVEPTVANARALPALVADMSRLYLPTASPDRRSPAAGDGSTASRDDAGGRIDARAVLDEAPAVGPRPAGADDPAGPYVGWLGEDPLDGTYLATPAAYRNRTTHLGGSEAVSATVVAVGDYGRARLDEYRPGGRLPVDPDVSTADELHAEAAAGADFFHGVGDWRDGNPWTDPEALDDAPPRAFFLDGPGAEAAGRSLLERGSVAGAVAPAPDADAAAGDSVRRLFLRGFLGGFTIDLARRYANAYGVGDPVTVLGDGTLELHRLDQSHVFPIRLEPTGDGRYRVTLPALFVHPGRGFGGMALDRWQLGGSTFERVLTATEVVELLDARWYLIDANETLYRPDDVAPYYPLV